MFTTDYIPVGSPVVVRSFVSGVVAGHILGGSDGSVSLKDWRWLREWTGVGGSGSVYDLIASDVVPSARGPLTAAATVLSQADVLAIDEATYVRLTS